MAVILEFPVDVVRSENLSVDLGIPPKKEIISSKVFVLVSEIAAIFDSKEPGETLTTVILKNGFRFGVKLQEKVVLKMWLDAIEKKEKYDAMKEVGWGKFAGKN